MDDDVVTANAGPSLQSSRFDCIIEGMLNTNDNFANINQQTDLKVHENDEKGKVKSDSN